MMQPTAPCSAATFGLIPRQEFPYRAITMAPFTEMPSAIELLVVLGEPVVHVDERRGDVAVHRVGVIGRQLLGFLPGGGIDGERGLLEAGHEPRRLHHLQHPLLRRRKEHGEGLDLRVPAGLQEPSQDPFRVLPAVGRADVMRPRREMAHRLAEATRVRNGAELRLHFPLLHRALAREATEHGIVGRHRDTEQHDRQGGNRQTAHAPLQGPQATSSEERTR